MQLELSPQKHLHLKVRYERKLQEKIKEAGKNQKDLIFQKPIEGAVEQSEEENEDEKRQIPIGDKTRKSLANSRRNFKGNQIKLR